MARRVCLTGTMGADLSITELPSEENEGKWQAMISKIVDGFIKL